MATNTLQQILGYVSLLPVVEKVKTGVPNPFPPSLMVSNSKVEGDSGRYVETSGTRQTARANQYGSSARRRVMRGIGSRDVKLVSSYEELPIPPLVLQQLRNYDNPQIMEMGRQEVVRQIKQFTTVFQNLRIACTGLVLGYGRFGFDADGNLLLDSGYSGAAEQVTFNVPAGNQSTIGGTITGWSQVTTDIPGQIRALKLKALQTTGYPLKHVFYGINVPTFVNANNLMSEYLARNPRENADFLATGEIGNLFDLVWHPVYTSFFADTNDANQTIWGSDLATFTPEIDPQWWDVIEGSSLIPTSINIITDGLALLNNLKQVWGMYAYGKVTDNPVGITQFMGDLFLACLKNPNAIFQATTT